MVLHLSFSTSLSEWIRLSNNYACQNCQCSGGLLYWRCLGKLGVVLLLEEHDGLTSQPRDHCYFHESMHTHANHDIRLICTLKHFKNSLAVGCEKRLRVPPGQRSHPLRPKAGHYCRCRDGQHTNQRSRTTADHHSGILVSPSSMIPQRLSCTSILI